VFFARAFLNDITTNNKLLKEHEDA
jgi:hypothetical protein